jgi:hypothetical protein
MHAALVWQTDTSCCMQQRREAVAVALGPHLAYCCLGPGFTVTMSQSAKPHACCVSLTLTPV